MRKAMVLLTSFVGLAFLAVHSPSHGMPADDHETLATENAAAESATAVGDEDVWQTLLLTEPAVAAVDSDAANSVAEECQTDAAPVTVTVDARAGSVRPTVVLANQRKPHSLAAREILKLRRAVGVNPIEGTIFDHAGRDAAVLVEDSQEASAADEQTLAEAIEHLENEESTTRQESSEYGTWPSPNANNPWAMQLLRPAEHHLEEAAALLEQSGQYERADSVREIAAQIRRDARQQEARQQSATAIWSTPIAGETR